MAWVAQEWESARGMHSRGELGEEPYLRRCGELSDSLGSSREDEELRYRIDLLRCLEGEALDRRDTVDLLPALWTMYRNDPARFPSHPDATGGGTDGTGDTDGLPNLFELLWQEVVLSAAQRPDVDREHLDHLAGLAVDALRELGSSPEDVAEASVRVLLSLGRLDEAQALLDDLPEPVLPAEPTWAQAHRHQRDLDVRGMVALQRGELDVAAAIVEAMENAPEAHVQPTVMLAESLIPLSGVVAPEVTAARAAFVADRSVGSPELSDALLQVAEYLAVFGHEAHALGLLDRMLPTLALHRRDPEADVHLLEGLHTVYAAAAAAGHGSVRPQFAGLPAVVDWLAVAGERAGGGTVAGLARWTGERARRAASALDARNGNDVETTVGLGLHRVPEGAAAQPQPLPASAALSVTPAVVPSQEAALPSWVEDAWLHLPREVADWRGEVSGVFSPEIPVAGPVDLESLGAGDTVAALMLYSMLGLEEAVQAAVDRLAELADGLDPRFDLGVHRDLVEELLRRYDARVLEEYGDDEDVDVDDGDDGDDEEYDAEASDASDTPAALRELDELLRARQRTQDEVEDSGADPVTILAARVGTVAGLWQGSGPLVRRVIEQDVLMGGVYPDQVALRLALRAVRQVTRLVPRSLPEVGSALLAGIAEQAGQDGQDDPGVPALVAQVAHYVAGVALSLPAPPVGPTAMLAGEEAPELLDELLSLGVALSGHGAFHEALAVYERCLRAVTGGEHGEHGAAPEDAATMRIHLLAARGETLAKLGNHRAAAGAFAEASDSAQFREQWEAAAEYQVNCVSSLLDDRDYPRAAFVLESVDDIEGLDWMRFPHASFRREVEATRLASALVGENFARDWPGQVERLKDAYRAFHAAASAGGAGASDASQEGQDGPGMSPQELGLRAAGDLVDQVLAVNRGLVHTDRVDEALALTAWAAGEAKDAEGRFVQARASARVQAHSDSAVESARLEALTEEALLLHVAGRDDEALLVFESVAQQARRAGADWLLAAVTHRLEAAAHYGGDTGVRERYSALLADVTGAGAGA